MHTVESFATKIVLLRLMKVRDVDHCVLLWCWVR